MMRGSHAANGRRHREFEIDNKKDWKGRLEEGGKEWGERHADWCISQLPGVKMLCNVSQRKKSSATVQNTFTQMTDTILVWNKPCRSSNKKHSCYLPLLTDNKVKEWCWLHGLKVALPPKDDTWSITLMAHDISPRRASAASSHIRHGSFFQCIRGLKECLPCHEICV